MCALCAGSLQGPSPLLRHLSISPARPVRQRLLLDPPGSLPPCLEVTSPPAASTSTAPGGAAAPARCPLPGVPGQRETRRETRRGSGATSLPDRGRAGRRSERGEGSAVGRGDAGGAQYGAGTVTLRGGGTRSPPGTDSPLLAETRHGHGQGRALLLLWGERDPGGQQQTWSLEAGPGGTRAGL
ncbi:unnamed protein product [Lampetra fluviatilis]